MYTIWDTTYSSASNVLPNNLHVKVAIIGGGLAGILTAYKLKEKNIDAVVLEGNTIGSGQTGHTSAKITCQHHLLYHTLISMYGEKKAALYAQANIKAIDSYHELIQSLRIDCDFKRLPAYLYSTLDDKALILEYGAAKRLKIQSHLTSKVDLPFSVKGSLRFDNQAQFHPIKFINALAKNLIIYDHCLVQDVSEHTLTTTQGCLTADHIVFASHYPLMNKPGYYFTRLYQERSYLLALDLVPPLDGMYLGIDPNSLSMRSNGSILLLGGGQHRTGNNSSGMKYEFLRHEAAKYWKDYPEIACWSAQDCMTSDHIPYIGLYSSNRPYWYVATGFNKWGMTSAMVAATLISDAIHKKEHPASYIFDPSRTGLLQLGKTIFRQSIPTVKALSKVLLPTGNKDLETMANDSSTTVVCNNERAGVYKDAQGKLHIVSIRCPHLGCQLEWNEDEKTWDCPCHGSRFSYDGKLLDNPAKKNLKIFS